MRKNYEVLKIIIKKTSYLPILSIMQSVSESFITTPLNSNVCLLHWPLQLFLNHVFYFVYEEY